MAFPNVGMGRAEDDVERVGMTGEDLLQRVDDVLDALVRREQPEGEQHRFTVDAELMLAASGHRHRRDAVRTTSMRSAVRGTRRAATPRRSYSTRDARRDGRSTIITVRCGDRLRTAVCGGDDRHPQLAQEREHVVARFAAEDPELVLHACDVDHVDVQEVGRPLVRSQLGLRDLEPHARRVRQMAPGRVHRDHEAIDGRHSGRERLDQVGGERRDPTPSRKPLPAVIVRRDL
jgi:hypothetical protein